MRVSCVFVERLVDELANGVADREAEGCPCGRSKLKMLESAPPRNRTRTLEQAQVCLARAGIPPLHDPRARAALHV